MKSILNCVTDARQSREWGEFLGNIGWEAVVIDGVYIFIRKMPLVGRVMLKIQHPKGQVPFRKIEKLAKERRALFTVIEPHPQGYLEREYLKHGYHVSKLRFAHSATILIDLQQSEEHLLASFSENARRNIRKAGKRLRVEAVFLNGKDSEEAMEVFFALYSQLGKTKKFYVPGRAEVMGKLRAFSKTSVILFAYENDGSHPEQSEGSRDSSHSLRMTSKRLPRLRQLADPRNDVSEPVAALWVGWVGKTMVYFHPGNTERGYQLLANYLLVWEALKLAKKQKLEIFDFESIYDPRYGAENKQWKGYTEFKQKFGGEELFYPPSWVKFYSPVFKAVYLFSTLFSK